MRNQFAIAASSILARAATPAMAGGDWENTLNAQIQGPLTIGTVSLTAEMEETAQNVGPEDVQDLLDDLRSDTEQALGQAGLLSSGPSAVTVNLYLADAEPNRPTHWQLSGKGVFGDSDDPRARVSQSNSLSLRSIALGGVEVTAEFVDQTGASLGAVTYDYEENTLEDVKGYATWTTANRGIERFARKLPGKLAPTS